LQTLAHNDKHTNPGYVEAIKLKGCHFGSVRRSLVLVGIGNGVGNWVVRGDPGGRWWGGGKEKQRRTRRMGQQGAWAMRVGNIWWHCNML